MAEVTEAMSRKKADALADAMREHELAEARKADRVAEKFVLEADLVRRTLQSREIDLERDEMRLEQDKFKYREWQAGDAFHHSYLFTTSVTEDAVSRCMAALDFWDRTEPRCDISITFNSPGGSVIDGLALFDHIQMLRRKGHKITTMAEGMAASMAGILLQAGDVRAMGAETWVLIHEVSFGAYGKIGEIEDEVEFIKRIQERVIDIFARRCAEAKENGTATKALTRAQLVKGWRRKDWWISSEDCLKFGLVDEVR